MKLRLDTGRMLEAFFENTRCLGIIAPVKSYQFCWMINASLNMDFRASTMDDIQMKKYERKYHFALFHYKIDDGLEHFIYENQYDGEYLLPELRHLDYIWLIRMEEQEDQYVPDLVKSIKDISGVQLVIDIPEDKIKNRAHLII